MSTDDERAALAELAALRAALRAHGLDGAVDGADPADRRTAADDDAAIARILAAGPAQDDVAAPAAAPTRAAAPTPAVRPDTDPADAPPAPVVPLRARRVRPWWLAATGAAAAVAVAVGLGVSDLRAPTPALATGSPPMLAYPLDPHELAQGAGEPARDTLRELAAVAGSQEDPGPRGQVQHVLSQSWLLSTNAQGDGTSESTVDPTVVESWLGPDGSLVTAEWRGAQLAADGRLGAVDTSPDEAAVDRLRAGAFDPDLVADLSLDPDTLREQLRAPLAATGCGPDAPAGVGAWCLYRAVADLSSRYVLPSDVEAAVWEALADEPGVTVAGEVVDRTGRTAVAVSVPGAPTDPDPTVRVLLLDEATGRLSGLEEVVLSSAALGFAEPTVTQFRYVVTSDFVGEVGGPGARR